jgi:hypothetical protein
VENDSQESDAVNTGSAATRAAPSGADAMTRTVPAACLTTMSQPLSSVIIKWLQPVPRAATGPAYCSCQPLPDTDSAGSPGSRTLPLTTHRGRAKPWDWPARPYGSAGLSGRNRSSALVP